MIQHIVKYVIVILDILQKIFIIMELRKKLDALTDLIVRELEK